MIKLKDILAEIEEASVYATSAGHGTKHTRAATKSGEQYSRNRMTGGMPGGPPSTEYTVTPQERELMARMTRSQQVTFLKRKRNQSRKERGLCIQCGGRLGTTDKKTLLCPDCQAHKNKLAQERRKRNVEKGLCIVCNEPVVRDSVGNIASVFCKKHRDAVVNIYHKKKKIGKCSQCNEPAVQNPDGTFQSLCAKHAKKHTEIYRDRMKKGLCVQCGEPAIKNPDGTFQTRCSKHIQRVNAPQTGPYHKTWNGWEIEESK